MNFSKGLEEDIKGATNQICKNRNKQWNTMKKIVLNMKVEMEGLRKIQPERKLKTKNLEI